MRQLTYTEAVTEAIAEEMHRDPMVFVMGQGVGEYSGRYNRLSREGFDKARLHDTGIIERFEAGAGVGAALTGSRPIVDLSNTAFGSLAYDEVFGKAGLWLYEHGGNGDMRIPIVFRMSFSSYQDGAAEHARSRTADYMHGVGIKVVVPSNGYEAKGLMKTAIRDDNPVVFLDESVLARDKSDIPDEEYLIPFGAARTLRGGDACTVVSTAYTLKLVMEAAELLEEVGTSIEVIDLRTLIPLDIATILASVRKTGRLLVVDEDQIRCGVGAEIGFQVQERAFDALKAPVQRLGSPNIPTPASPKLRQELMPNPETIADAVRHSLLYRAGI